MKLDRSVRALEALAERQTPVGVMELSAAVGEPAPSLHRTLQVLLEHQLVVQEPDTRRYRLGPGILVLADAYRQQNRLVVIAQPVLDAMRSRLSESAFLCELVDERAVVVAVAESPRPFHSLMRLGHLMPFHAAASAKAILAFQPASRIERLLNREGTDRYTDRTKTDTNELLRELEDVRSQASAVCDQELEVGVKAIARPICDNSGYAVASIAVIAPRERLEGDRQEKALRELAEAASSVAELLGYRSNQPRSEPAMRVMAERPTLAAPGSGSK